MTKIIFTSHALSWDNTDTEYV